MEIKSSSDYVRMTRAALAAAGFTRTESEGIVWLFSDEHPSSAFGTFSPRGGEKGLDGTLSSSALLPARGEKVPKADEGSAVADRPLLVLLHGANDQAGTWFTVAPALAQQFRVILADLPGHGESQPQSGPLPISMIVDRIVSILPNEPFTLLGNSLGGWIALLYTLRHPERVRTLILEASGGIDRPFAVPLIATNREEADVILRAVHGPAYNAPEWVIEGLLDRAKDSPMLRVTETAEHFMDSRLAELRVPVHLIWGADDGVLPISYAHELQRGIEGAQLHVIEGAAHIPHLQQPQRFLECLTAIS